MVCLAEFGTPYVTCCYHIHCEEMPGSLPLNKGRRVVYPSFSCCFGSGRSWQSRGLRAARLLD